MVTPNFLFGYLEYLLKSTYTVSKHHRSGSARRRGGGGGGIPVYPKKIRQNTQKYPKFIQIHPKVMEALYTVYLKFKESDILNTRIKRK